MKQIGIFVLCLFVVTMAGAQEKRIDITGFEDLEAWAYSGTDVIESFVDFPADFGIPTHEGDAALFVNYEFPDPYPWNWNQLNFATGNIDLTGMREIHMWVYFEEGAVGDLSIRLDVGGGSLGTQEAPSAGEWHELVWDIDRLTSDTRISDVGAFGGFLAPDSPGAAAKLWIDEVFAIRPAGIPDLEQVLVYGFNEEDPNTLAPVGWENGEGDQPFVGQGEVEPSEGSNYMVAFLTDGWTRNVQTVNAMEAFDRWPEVVEIMVDARISSEFTGSWVQSDLILQSGVNDADGNPVDGIENVTGWDGQGKEIGYSGFVDEWKTLLWQVDMSKHLGAFENEGGWFTVSFTTNNAGDQAGIPVYFDNFRVSVPVGGPVHVNEWSLY